MYLFKTKAHNSDHFKSHFFGGKKKSFKQPKLCITITASWSKHSTDMFNIFFVYMHTNIPQFFQMWQYSKFRMGHVNS